MEALLTANEELVKSRKKYMKKLKKIDEKIAVNNRSLAELYGGRKGKSISKKEQKEMIEQIQKLPAATETETEDDGDVFGVKKKLIPTNHKYQIKLLEFSSDGSKFVTTCTGGQLNLWDCKSSNDPSIIGCVFSSTDRRRWPEDIAFFPNENRLVAVYKTPDRNQQIAFVNFDSQDEAGKKVYLHYEAELKIEEGVKRVMFPNSGSSFVTAGEDRSVYLWSTKNDNPTHTPTICHKEIHSSSINGLCALTYKSIVLSAGLDNQVVGYDFETRLVDSSMKMNGACLGMSSNPYNPNLLVIQTRTNEKQLKLVDYRVMKIVGNFGWRRTEKLQSMQVNPSWSPSGWLLSTGSVDPNIYLFDIRVNRVEPTQVIKNAHSKKVQKAVWAPIHPLLISISTDHFLGTHSIENI